MFQHKLYEMADNTLVSQHMKILPFLRKKMVIAIILGKNSLLLYNINSWPEVRKIIIFSCIMLVGL